MSDLKILRKQDWFHPDGFPVVVERRDPQEPFGLHAHEFSEIVIITGGKGLHITGEDSYELQVGDAFVIGGTRPHDYLNMKELSLINILFDADELPMTLGDLQSLPGYHGLFALEPAWRKRHKFGSRLQLSPIDLIKAMEQVDRLEQELTTRAEGFRVMATSIFLQLVTFLSRCYNRSAATQSKSLLKVAETISYIERRYPEPITLESLVEISGMSRRSFLRSFESTFGCPPITYLIRLRLQHACRLLQHSDDSIQEISARVGFTDSNYFSRQFRALIGCTPREFRKNLRSTSLANKVPVMN